LRELTFYDFFAGAGLVELGMGADWTCVWANDNDPKKAEVYNLNFDGAVYHLGDVAKQEASALPIGVDMAWASFPCQDLSLAGWRRGMSAERSGAFWPFWRLMRDLHDADELPSMIVIENVTGLLYGQSFVGLCEALAGLGMNFGVLLIDAKHFVPQSRPRVFLIAIDERTDTTSFEDQAPESSPWLPKPIHDAYGQLPAALQLRWKWWALPFPKEKPQPVEALIENEPEGVDWHSEQETQRLLGMMSEENLSKVVRAKASGSTHVGLLYKRTRNGIQRAEVRFDGIAGCLRTPSGGSSRQTVLIIDNGNVRSRLLSPRETARLMGVQDSFVLPTGYNHAYKAMGDAVAVPAVAWLSQCLLTPLAEKLRAETHTHHGLVRSDRHAFRINADAMATQWLMAQSE